MADQGTDWPAWISALAAAATLIVVVVTASVALRGLRDARQTRHGQLVTELMRDWTEPNMVEAIKLHGQYAEPKIVQLIDTIWGPAKRTPTEDEQRDYAKLILVANMIEALGVLASEKAITPEAIYKMWGGAILSAWPKWDTAINNLRIYDKEPDTFIHFESLAAEIRRISAERKAAAKEQADHAAIAARPDSTGFQRWGET
jgi:hypothetical protein